MKNMTEENSGKGLLLRKNKVDYADGVLVYELRAVRTEDGVLLSVSVKFGKDTTVCLFATRIGDVLRFYKTVVQNTVTPCTLQDVAEDFKNKFILDKAN